MMSLSPMIQARFQVALFGMVLATTSCRAQFTIDFVVDQNLALAALSTQAEVDRMLQTLGRVKAYFDSVLSEPNVGSMQIPLRWTPPLSAGASAEAITAERRYAWNTVKERLVAVASERTEPQEEINLYESFLGSSIPFVWAPTDSVLTPRNATHCILTYPQTLQLLLTAGVPTGDENNILVRPPGGELEWQFYRGPVEFGLRRFDSTIAHEVIHLLGFISSGEVNVAPTDTIHLMDVYRFADSSFPISAAGMSSVTRDLRPGPASEASLSYRSGLALADGLPMSRGKRPTGDTFQTSHFRSYRRLIPVEPIGIMDPLNPGDSDAQYGRAKRADFEVLDILGWSLNPASIRLDLGPSTPRPVQTNPPAGSGSRNPKPEFTWTDTTTNSLWYTLNIFNRDPSTTRGDPPIVYDNIEGNSFTIPDGDELAPGTYTWDLLGSPNELDYYSSGYRQFTILCPAYFNEDSVVDFFDYLDFVSAFSTMDPSADFNEDSSVDFFDYLDFVAAYSTSC